MHKVIVLGGRYLGAVAALECRDQSPTYVQPLKNMLQQAELNAANCILEVGCGSGVLTRFVYQCTNGTSAITGLDLNEFLVAEAKSLAEASGLTNQLEYQAGNALDLPFDDVFLILFIASRSLKSVTPRKCWQSFRA